MKTFLQHLIEEVDKPEGNYVGVGVDIGDFDVPVPITGSLVSPDKHHATVMYSRNTNQCPTKIGGIIRDKFNPEDIDAMAVSAEVFDDLPKAGEVDSGKGTLVLKLHAPKLHQIHKHLSDLGLEHSYPEYQPHVSIVYGIDREEGDKMVESLNKSGVFPHPVNLTHFNSDVIKKNASKDLLVNKHAE